MHTGQSSTIHRGLYKGDELSVNHIIPKSAASELNEATTNLKLLPLRMNEGKNDRIGERQIILAQRLKAAGLLTDAGLKSVLRNR